MAVPKNMSNKTDLFFAGCSFVGVLCTAFAASGVRIVELVPPSWFINFMCVMFGLYGLGFVVAPKAILEMNFKKTADNYHEAVARCMGAIFLWNIYCIYSGMMLTNTRKYAYGFFIITGIFGPTYNALYLDNINTPSGSPPGNILFLIGGLLAITAKPF
jgi:hypothetical protein